MSAAPLPLAVFLFATEKKQYSGGVSKDLNNKEFWNQMEEIFKATVELLEGAAEELGIDPSEIDSIVVEENEAENEKRVKQHRAAQNAHEYAISVNGFFEKTEKLFYQKGKELAEIAVLEIPGLDVSEYAVKLQDFIELIRWYQYQISAKIFRALRGKIDDFGLEDDPIQNDHNGSAKVALMGIERSIAAWGGLLKIFLRKKIKFLQYWSSWNN